MRTQIFTAASLAVLLAAVPAFAQSADPAAEKEPGMTTEQSTMPGTDSGSTAGTQPDSTSPATGTDSGATAGTSPDTGTPPATGTDSGATAGTQPDTGTSPDTDSQDGMAADVPPATTGAPNDGLASGELYIQEQSEDEILASELMGAEVHNGEGETIGEIKDVIITETEGVAGVVIGVGGFLGMGEKEVGVNFDEVDQTRNENGDVQLILMASAEELKEAQDFTTLSDKMAEEQAAQAAAQAPAGGTGATTAPATPQ